MNDSPGALLHLSFFKSLATNNSRIAVVEILHMFANTIYTAQRVPTSCAFQIGFDILFFTRCRSYLYFAGLQAIDANYCAVRSIPRHRDHPDRSIAARGNQVAIGFPH